MLTRASDHSVQIFVLELDKEPEDDRQDNMELVQTFFVNVNDHRIGKVQSYFRFDHSAGISEQPLPETGIRSRPCGEVPLEFLPLLLFSHDRIPSLRRQIIAVGNDARNLILVMEL